MSSSSSGTHKIKIPDVFAKNDQDESLKKSFDGKKSLAQIVKENAKKHNVNGALNYIKEQEKKVLQGETEPRPSILNNLLEKDERSKTENLVDNPPVKVEQFVPKRRSVSSPYSSQESLQKYIDNVVAQKMSEIEQRITTDNSMMQSTIEKMLIEERKIMKTSIENDLKEKNSLMESQIKEKISLMESQIDQKISEKDSAMENDFNKKNILMQSTFEEKINEHKKLMESKQMIDSEDIMNTMMERLTQECNRLNDKTFVDVNESLSKIQEQEKLINEIKSNSELTIQEQQKLIEEIKSNSEMTIKEQQLLIDRLIEKINEDKSAFETTISKLQNDSKEESDKLKSTIEEQQKIIESLQSKTTEDKEELENIIQRKQEKSKKKCSELESTIKEQQTLILQILQDNKDQNEFFKKQFEELKSSNQQLVQENQLMKSQLETAVKETNNLRQSQSALADKLKNAEQIKNINEITSRLAKVEDLTSLENIKYKPNHPVNPDIISAIIPKNVKTLVSGYYKNCTKLQKIIFEGNQIATIPSSFCEGCTKLEIIEIPSSVTEIGQKAFFGCSSLKNFNFSNIHTIHLAAFQGCGLESIDLSQVSLIEPYIFKENVNLNNVVIGSKITSIPKGLFEKCKSLTKIDIPITVEFISAKSFSETGISEINVRKAAVQKGSFDQGVKIYKHK